MTFRRRRTERRIAARRASAGPAPAGDVIAASKFRRYAGVVVVLAVMAVVAAVRWRLAGIPLGT